LSLRRIVGLSRANLDAFAGSMCAAISPSLLCSPSRFFAVALGTIL
jgi:hypothetical protein